VAEAARRQDLPGWVVTQKITVVRAAAAAVGMAAAAAELIIHPTPITTTTLAQVDLLTQILC
jgi:hypothetical protein